MVQIFRSYRVVGLPFVALHFGLQLVDEVLQANQVLLVFLSLQQRCRKTQLNLYLIEPLKDVKPAVCRLAGCLAAWCLPGRTAP